VGNLNKFYLLGRVAKAPEASGAGDARVVKVWLSPGTAAGNRRRGGGLPLLLHAYGAQIEPALELKVGQGVLARGQLRQESQGEGDALIAQIQALELLTTRPRRPRPEGEEGQGSADEGKSRRRRRRRRGRKPEGGEGAAAAEAKPAAPPPATPVVPPEPPPVAPPPDPSYTSDIPF